jgi:hypothetical protein
MLRKLLATLAIGAALTVGTAAAAPDEQFTSCNSNRIGSFTNYTCFGGGGGMTTATSWQNGPWTNWNSTTPGWNAYGTSYDYSYRPYRFRSYVRCGWYC